MTKTSKLVCSLFVLLSACGETDPNDATVPGEITAVLSGDGLFGNASSESLEYDEVWLDTDGVAALSGFDAHDWSTKAGEPAYDLYVEFEPLTAPGTARIVNAMACYVVCDKAPEKGGNCEGPCFANLKSGSVEVHELSEDGKSFDLSFAFEVADEHGAVIKVTDGQARTAE